MACFLQLKSLFSFLHFGILDLLFKYSCWLAIAATEVDSLIQEFFMNIKGFLHDFLCDSWWLYGIVKSSVMSSSSIDAREIFQIKLKIVRHRHDRTQCEAHHQARYCHCHHISHMNCVTLCYLVMMLPHSLKSDAALRNLP